MYLDRGRAVYHSLVWEAESRWLELEGRRIACVSEKISNRSGCPTRQGQSALMLRVRIALRIAKRLQWLCEIFTHGTDRA